MAVKYSAGVKWKRSDFPVAPPGEGGVRRRSTEADASIIKGMSLRGDVQHDITAYFGANSGRINETCTGHRYDWVEPAPMNSLPPAGPPMVAQVISPGVAEFKRMTEEMRKLSERQEQMQRLLLNALQETGAIERPRMPRIGRRNMLGA